MLDRLCLLVLHTSREFINWSNLLKHMSPNRWCLQKRLQFFKFKIRGGRLSAMFLPADASSKIG
jgi:hypothetical protein